MSLLRYYNEGLTSPAWVHSREIGDDVDLRDLQIQPGDYALYEPAKSEVEPGLPKSYRLVTRFNVPEPEPVKPQLVEVDLASVTEIKD